MAQVQIPVDLGFTEFVSTLLSEVVSSIAAAQSEQAQRLAELTAAAALSVEDFADQHVADAEVDAWLAARFPASDPDHPHGAASGEPYQPGEDDGPDEPPFTQLFDIRLTGSDFNSGRGVLNARGARKIFQAARLMIAEQELDVARSMLERGVPRVVVDAGRISAKLTFEALQFRDEATLPPAEDVDDGGVDDEAVVASSLTAPLSLSSSISPLMGIQDVVMIGRLPKLDVTPVLRQTLQDVRLRVRPADDRRPETGSTRANVYGEVELTFKTVT